METDDVLQQLLGLLDAAAPRPNGLEWVNDTSIVLLFDTASDAEETFMLQTGHSLFESLETASPLQPFLLSPEYLVRPAVVSDIKQRVRPPPRPVAAHRSFARIPPESPASTRSSVARVSPASRTTTIASRTTVQAQGAGRRARWTRTDVTTRATRAGLAIHVVRRHLHGRPRSWTTSWMPTYVAARHRSN